MRLASFTFDGRSRLGLIAGDEIVDCYTGAPGLPTDMTKLLEMGPDGLVQMQMLLEKGSDRLPLRQVELGPAVTRPGKFFGVGLNYAEHVAETGRDRPEYPTIFNKQITCVNGPYAPVHIPRASRSVDYEGELGVVIGTRCKAVKEADAMDVIAGYTVINDVTARDWQYRTSQWNMGKSFDTHGPMGPALVTLDEVGDPHSLQIRTWVNGEKRQDANTSQMIFKIPELIAYLSQVCTLEPGDVIATGTPSGVASAMQPPKWLQPNDVVRIEVERVGVIENRFIAEPEPGHMHGHH